jgi:hypothetical protein
MAGLDPAISGRLTCRDDGCGPSIWEQKNLNRQDAKTPRLIRHPDESRGPFLNGTMDTGFRR